MRPARSAAQLVAMVAAGALTAAGCASGSTRGSTASTQPPGASSPSAPAQTMPTTQTTVAGQLPTVYDCGGGAYKPATLLIVCGVGSTMATDVQWTSWTGTSAAGRGTVHLQGKSPAPAALALSRVVTSGSGPQFAQLQVTWTGASPDGRPSDVFKLDTAPAR